MKKEMWNKMSQENDFTRTCERADDMIAYLYGETSQSEAKDFERHIENCAACRTESSAFADVRASIGAWRKQSLGALAFPISETTPAPAFNAVRAERAGRRPSALAALREFFTLSPAWMRAATAVLSIAVCAVMTVAIAHAEIRWDKQGFSFSTGILSKAVATDSNTQTPAVAQTDKIYTREELNAIVAEKVRLEREALLNEMNSNKSEVITVSDTETHPASKRVTAASPGKVAPRGTSAPATVATPRSNMQQQQRVPQMIARDEEDNLPRLSDLLGDTR